MKKKLTIVFLSLLVIVLAIGGYILYEFKLKTYDTADPVVKELLEETFELELPDGSVVKIDQEGNIVTTAKVTEESQQVVLASVEQEAEAGVEGVAVESGTMENEQIPTAAANSNDAQDSITVADIKNRYAPSFTSLENQARNRLFGLIGQAKSEYSSKKAAGESIKYGYFYNKYMGAASSIEAATDAAMNTLVNMVENDLQKNGFDKSYAQSFREQYEASKESLRSEMFAKVKGAQ